MVDRDARAAEGDRGGLDRAAEVGGVDGGDPVVRRRSPSAWACSRPVLGEPPVEPAGRDAALVVDARRVGLVDELDRHQHRRRRAAANSVNTAAGDRERGDGARPAPAVQASAPRHEQHDRPRERTPRRSTRKTTSAAPWSEPPLWNASAAEHRQPHRPDEEEREHERRRREAGDVPRLPVGRGAVGGPAAEVHRAAEDPEVLDPDQQPGDDRLDEDEQPVELDVVEQPAGRAWSRGRSRCRRGRRPRSAAPAAPTPPRRSRRAPRRRPTPARSARGRAAATSRARPAPAGLRFDGHGCRPVNSTSTSGLPAIQASRS